MSALVIAREELARLLATRRGWLSLLAFALLWAAVLVYVVLPVTRWLAESSDSGLADAVLGALGLTALAGWPAPQLAVYWLVALYLLPPFAVLVAADQTASDRARGTLRFHALRASRATLFLGRFAGQCLIQLGLVLVTLASVLAVVAVQAPERLADAFAAAVPAAASLFALLLPFVALMALCSALARSARQATLLAVVFWIVVSVALGLARDAFGPLAAFEHVLPGSESARLRASSGAGALAHAPVSLVQTLVLLALGLLVFRRRDL